MRQGDRELGILALHWDPASAGFRRCGADRSTRCCFASPYDLRMLTICGIYALLVLGFQFVFGHAGAVSLAQATFFGIGGYITGILATRFGFPFSPTFPLSIAGPALLAVIIGAAGAQARGALLLAGDAWHRAGGAAAGHSMERCNRRHQWACRNSADRVPGLTIADRRSVLWFVWAIVAIGCLLAYQVTRGLHGQAYHLMRENPEAASSLGLNIAELRFGAFVLARPMAAPPAR